MKTINTIRGTKNLADYKRVLPHEHLLIDITHEAVEQTDAEAKELFYSEVKMENLGVLRRNPYIIRENLILSLGKPVKILLRSLIFAFIDVRYIVLPTFIYFSIRNRSSSNTS